MNKLKIQIYRVDTVIVEYKDIKKMNLESKLQLSFINNCIELFNVDALKNPSLSKYRIACCKITKKCRRGFLIV